MLIVQISTASGAKEIYRSDNSLKISEIYNQIPELKENCYVIHNGKLLDENCTCYDGYINVVPRLFGGKGGFGSMLRAIGAQIEKTTNREACRDLSGRRLRDINEEKRLKAWIEKQGKREEEAAERRKKKLERLCSEPRHEFKDKVYERERSALTEKVGDAVEEGFKLAAAGVKRKVEEEVVPNKKKLLLDIDIDSDELDTSSDSDDEQESNKIITHTEPISNDSGNSSDESAKVAQKNDNTLDVNSANEVSSEGLDSAETKQNTRTK